MAKFSIITPVTYDLDNGEELRMPRYKMFQRCITSVQSQTIKDFVWVIADDMCNPPVEKIPGNATIIRLPEKSGRIIATNRALEAAEGEWICFLDADDEYSSIYLEAINDAIRLNPEYKVFNMNHLIYDYNYKTWIRKFINMAVQGKRPFPSGVIGTGSYFFHRSVLEDVGLFPEMGLWEFSGDFFEKYPETKVFFEVKGEPGQYNSLGNPWGTDYHLFYRITRKYDCKYLDTALYYVHSRWGHKWNEDPEYIIDPGKAPEVNPNNI